MAGRSSERGVDRSMLNRLERTASQVQTFVKNVRDGDNESSDDDNFITNMAAKFKRARTDCPVNLRKKRNRGRPTEYLCLKVTCLSSPTTTTTSNLDVSRLKRLGLGFPDAELKATGRVPSKINLGFTKEQLTQMFQEMFPVLKNVSYELMVSTRSKLEKIPSVMNTPALIKAYMSSEKKCGGIFIRPCIDVTEFCLQELTRHAPSSTTDTMTESGLSTSTIVPSTGANKIESLQERRNIISEQDKEYEESLLADIEKERNRQSGSKLKEDEIHVTQLEDEIKQREEEEKRLKEFRDRKKLNLPDEPVGGSCIKLKFRTNSNWSHVARNFCPDEDVQVLQDFICTLEDSRENYTITLPNRQPISSLYNRGTIADLGIHGNTLVQIQWLTESESLPALLKCNNVNNQYFIIRCGNLFKMVILHRIDISSGNSEGAIDTGGLTRELFQMAVQKSTELPIFEGENSSLQLRRCDQGFEDNLYFFIGQLYAMSLVHGGPAPAFMSPLMRSYVLGKKPEPSLKDIYDARFHGQIKELAESQTKEEVIDLLGKSTLLQELIGFSKPIRTLDDRDDLVQKMVNFLMIDNVKAAYEEFLLGFSKLSVLPAIRKNQVMEEVIKHKEQNITARDMRKCFKDIFFSASGSNHHKLEVQRLCWLEDFFVEIENGTVNSTFEDVFAFTTGLRSPPPLGLNPEPSIAFLHTENLAKELGQKDHFLPVANTCINQLKIPCNPNITRCRRFISDLELAFTGYEGFCNESLVQDEVFL